MKQITNGEEILTAIKQGLQITDDRASEDRASKFARTVSDLKTDLDSLKSAIPKLTYKQDAQKYFKKAKEGLDGLSRVSLEEQMYWEEE